MLLGKPFLSAATRFAISTSTACSVLSLRGAPSCPPLPLLRDWYARMTGSSSKAVKKNYILDTNVLLHDQFPAQLQENQICCPSRSSRR